MSVSIGWACNFHAEKWALPGMLENASQFFDDILCISTPPEGVEHDEESIEIIKKWGARLELSSLKEGFGVVRTKALHALTTEWGFLGDCDERVIASHKVLHCEGAEKYPQTPSPNLKVIVHDPCYNHGGALKNLLSIENYDCIRACRRAWFDFSWTRPCQSWHSEPDWQCRILRNREYIGFRPERKMHELVVNFRTGKEPEMWRGDSTSRGIFIEHFSNFFKKMEPEQNAQDLAAYKSLDAGLCGDMWLNHQPGVK